MKTAVLVALALCAGSACAQKNIGGTLHQSTLREWRIATPGDQLATVTDIVGRILSNGDPLAVKSASLDVQMCVNRVAANFKLGTQTVADTAVACLAELGFLRR